MKFEDKTDHDLRSMVNYLIERESNSKQLNDSFVMINTIREMNRELLRRDKERRKEKRDEV